MDNLERFIRLGEKQKEEFYKIIHSCRSKYISEPFEHSRKAFKVNNDIVQEYLKSRKISELITFLREAVYDEYLVSEKKFIKQVIIELNEHIKISSNQMDFTLNSIISLPTNNKENLKYSVGTIISDHISAIFPYIYELALSNTQSRRSRAGKTFEFIIYTLYEAFNYPYDSQAKIGKKVFKEQNLGKIVDSILPSVGAFNQHRNKTIVGSMKTTLRERWQEVVEEVSRSNLPNIYLLTIDEEITESKIKQMAEHNIILVVLKKVKETDILSSHRNVISFENYFFEDIPTILNYWRVKPL